MAWGANARNRSAEVRRVNYHEDGGSSGRRSNNSGGGNNNGGGDISPFGKVIIGGVCIYALGSVGLGWVTDTIGNIKDALDFTDDVKTSISESRNGSNNNTARSSGTTVKNKNVDTEIDISSQDVADLIEAISDSLNQMGINASKANVVILDYSVFQDDEKYQKKIIDRLDKYDNSVTFMAIKPDTYITEQAQLDEVHAEMHATVERNRTLKTDKFTHIQTTTNVHTPNYGDVVVSVTFS